MPPAAPAHTDEGAALADQIALLAAHLDAATHRLLTCIRHFDASAEWHRQGAMSCAHWLTWRIGLDPNTAREKVRVARALATLPLLDAALHRGQLSYAKLRAITRIATPENEAVLLEMALHTTGAHLERLCRMLRRVSATDETGTRLDELRCVSEQRLDNGMVKVTILLHPDEAALFMKAIEQARLPDAPAAAAPSHSPSPSPRDGDMASAAAEPRATDAPAHHFDVSAETPRLHSRPDAIVRLSETFLAHRNASTPSRPELFVHLPLHLAPDPLSPGTLAATLDDGTRVSAETFRRLTCDTTITCVSHAPDTRASESAATATSPAANTNASAPQLSTRTRTISPALRRTLAVRDANHCRFPACTNHRFLHAHHIHHWAHGGKTTPENLILLCTAHHRMVHEGAVQVERSASGEVRFGDAAGRELQAAPPAWHVEGEGMNVVAGWNDEEDLRIEQETNLSRWDGEPVNYHGVIDWVGTP